MFSYGEFKAEDQVILFVLIVLAVEFFSYRLVLAWHNLVSFANVVFLHSVSKVAVVWTRVQLRMCTSSDI